MGDKVFWKTFSRSGNVSSFQSLACVGRLLLDLIYIEQMTNAGIVYGLGFLSFIYANVARFKRFKGLGFEAELWEDKQQEAADLIDPLKNVVSIYTREVILGKVKAGRLGSGSDWKSRWKLYDDLVTQHSILGQKIDFSDLKKEMDDYFLFDITMPAVSKIREAAGKGKSAAMQKINQEFGTPVRDHKGHGERFEQYRAVPAGIENPFEISTTGDLAGHALNVWRDIKERLKRDFDVSADLDPKVIERLETISKIYQSRPVQVTDELISWTNWDG
jgi:hypothetical protein